jgi:hypothetical protein
MQSLDVTYIDILLTENNSAKLEFEANGYPYGGPDSLITLIKSFDCLPTKVDDGGGLYEIKWKSKIKYDFIPLS